MPPLRPPHDDDGEGNRLTGLAALGAFLKVCRSRLPGRQRESRTIENDGAFGTNKRQLVLSAWIRASLMLAAGGESHPAMATTRLAAQRMKCSVLAAMHSRCSAERTDVPLALSRRARSDFATMHAGAHAGLPLSSFSAHREAKASAASATNDRSGCPASRRPSASATAATSDSESATGQVVVPPQRAIRRIVSLSSS